MLKCIFNLKEDGTLEVNLPQGKTMKEINEEAKKEIEFMERGFYGKDIKVFGRITTALAMLLGHELGHICKSVSLFDPKLNKYIEIIKY